MDKFVIIFGLLSIPSLINVTYFQGLSSDFSNLLIEATTANQTLSVPFDFVQVVPGQWATVSALVPEDNYTLSFLSSQENAPPPPGNSTQQNGSSQAQQPLPNGTFNQTEQNGSVVGFYYNVTDNQTSQPAENISGNQTAPGNLTNQSGQQIAPPAENSSNATAQNMTENQTLTGQNLTNQGQQENLTENQTGAGNVSEYQPLNLTGAENLSANQSFGNLTGFEDITNGSVQAPNYTLNVTYMPGLEPDFSNLVVEFDYSNGSSMNVSYSILNYSSSEWALIGLGTPITGDVTVSLLAGNRLAAPRKRTNGTVVFGTFRSTVMSFGNGNTIDIDNRVFDRLNSGQTVRVIVLKSPMRTDTTPHGLPVLREIDSKGTEALSISVDDLDLLAGAGVAQIYPDTRMGAALNDTVRIIGSDRVQSELGFDGTGIAVCLLDTGVNDNGSFGGKIASGFNFVANNTDTSDDQGHGTLMAAIIHTIAPGAEIIPVKVLDSSGNGYSSDIMAGISYCMQRQQQDNVKVVSMSFGGGNYTEYCDADPVAIASQSAYDAGLMPVASSGNDHADFIEAPACGENVTAVSSTSKSDIPSAFADLNPLVDLLAPGEGVVISGSNLSGTSISAADVAGASALLFQSNSSLTPWGAEARFMTTGQLIEHDGTIYPRINVYNAVTGNFTGSPTNGHGNHTNVTGNYTYHVLITTCTQMNTPQTVYTMSANIIPGIGAGGNSMNASCMNVSTNATLNCANFAIVGSNSVYNGTIPTWFAYAINITGANTSSGCTAGSNCGVYVQNCNLTNWSSDILISGTSYVTLLNINASVGVSGWSAFPSSGSSIIVNGGIGLPGVLTGNGSRFLRFINLNATNNGTSIFNISNANFTNITGSWLRSWNATANCLAAINLNTSVNQLNIEQTNITSAACNGITWTATSGNITINQSIINTTTGNAISCASPSNNITNDLINVSTTGTGLNFSAGCNNINVTNVTVFVGTTGSAATLTTASNNTFSNVSLNSSTGTALTITTNANNNSFTNCTFGSNGVTVISIASSNLTQITYSSINETLAAGKAVVFTVANTNKLNTINFTNISVLGGSAVGIFSSATQGGANSWMNYSNIVNDSIKVATTGIGIDIGQTGGWFIADNNITVSGAGVALALNNSTINALIVRNLFSSTTGRLLDIANATNNTIYWNNFTNTSGTMVNSTVDSVYGVGVVRLNYLNTSVGGVPEGNAWYDVVNGTTHIRGKTTSVPWLTGGFFFGTTGPAYPYNNTTTMTSKFTQFTGNLVDWGPITQNWLACGTLNESNNLGSNATYIMNNTPTVPSGSSCINITNQNVTLNCSGFSIIGANTTGTYGVSINASNATVTDCNIFNFQYGVYLNGSNAVNDTVRNNTINISSSGGAMGGVGIMLSNLSTGSLIFLNAVNSSANTSLLIYNGSSNNTVANNTFNGTSFAISVNSSSSFNNFTNNTLVSTSGILLGFDISSGNNTAWWNNFSGTSAPYVADANGSNLYNITNVTTGIGNYWANVISGSVAVSGLYPAPQPAGTPFALYYGVGGSGYPYSSSTSLGKFVGTGTDYAPVTQTQTPQCGVALSSSGTYTMFSNITASKNTCINITSSGVVLNCNGYKITGDNTTNMYGIYTTQPYVTVKNCIVSSFYQGIFFNGSIYSNMTNNTAYSNLGYGIWLSYTNASNVSNNSALTNGWAGILLYNSNNDTVNGSNIGANLGDGLRLDSAANDSVYNTNAYNSTGSGIVFNSSTNITGDNLTSYANQLYGYYFLTSTNSLLANSSAYNNTQHGVYISSASNNNFLQNVTSRDNAQYGFYLASSNSVNSSYANASNNTAGGIYLFKSSSDIFTNTLLQQNWKTGIELAGTQSTGNNFTGISINGTGASHGIYVGGSANNFFICANAVNPMINNTGNGTACLQGLANTSTSCGGNPSGTYTCNTKWDPTQACALAADGSWSTYGVTAGSSDAFMWANYSKPSGASNQSVWQAQLGTRSITNYTLTQGCWSQNPIQIQMGSLLNGSAQGYCWDGSVWNIIATTSGSPSANRIYEGSMYWDLQPYGFYTSAQNTTVMGCNISGFYNGIEYYNANGSISNDVAHDNWWNGVSLNGSNNATIANTTAYNNNGSGVYLTGSSSNNISNTTSYSNTQSGAMLDSTSQNDTISGFTAYSNTLNGIYLSTSGYNNITNSSATGATGVNIVGSANNIISNSTAAGTGSYGLSIASSSSNLVTTCSISNTAGPALYMSLSSLNTVANSTLNGTTYSLELTASDTSNNFTNNTLLNGTGSSTLFYVVSSTSNGNTAWWNNFTATSGLYVSDAATSATPNFYNVSNVTTGEGNIYANVVNGSVNTVGTYPAPFPSGGATAFYYGAAGSGYPYNTTNSLGLANMSSSDYGPITPTLQSTCRNLTANYTLTSNVTSTGGTCFSINANNITLKCSGFSIIGANASANLGVFSNQNYSLVRDCYITNFAEDIEYNNGVGGTMYNNTLLTTFLGGNASHITNASNLTNMTSNGISSGDANGTVIDAGSQNVTVNCNGLAMNGSNYTNTYGVYTNQPNTTLANCKITSFGRSAFWDGASGGLIGNNSLNTTYYGDYAFYADGTNSNLTIENNTFFANFGASGLGAVYLLGTTGSLFTNNTMNTSDGYTLVLGSGASGNNLTNNIIYAGTATSATYYAVYWSDASGGNFSNNTVLSRSGGMYSDGTSGSRIFSSNLVYCNQAGNAVQNYCLRLQSTGTFNITNSRIEGGVTGAYITVFVLNGKNANFANDLLLANATTANTYLQTSKNNNFTNNTILDQYAGYNLFVFINGANSNIINGNNMGSISTIGTISSGNTIANNTVFYNSTIEPSVLYFPAGSPFASNTFANNSISSGVSGPLLFLGSDSGLNTFYWNNFTNTSGYTVNDTNGSNYYNTSNGTVAEGNIWADVINGSVAIQGTYPAPFPSGGASAFYYGNTSASGSYPYNNTTALSGRLYGNVTDWGPITPTLASSGTSCQNVSSNLTLSANITSTGGTCFSINANNITLNCSGYYITGPNTTGSIAVYSNQNATTVRDCRILNFSEEIQINNGQDSYIYNNSLNDTFSGGNATHILNGSNRSRISANYIINNWANGAYIEGGSQNVTLNCSGLNITGNNATGTYGVATRAFNTTIANCTILGFDYGVNFANQSYNGTAEYSNLTLNLNYGVRFVNSSNNTLLNVSLCSNFIDIDNSGLNNTGSFDTCNSFLNFTENGHIGCTFACTSLWQQFFGNVSGTIILGNNNVSPYVYSWAGTGLNVYMANHDDSINWSNVQAIGTNKSGGASTGDFLQLDTALSSSSLRDNITATYSPDPKGSGARYNDTFTVYSRTINNVPVYNSSVYNTTFRTGILYDTSNGHASYDGSQATVWAVKVNTTQADTYGNYQYMIRIPYTLSTYRGTNGLVSFYAELQ